MKFRLPKLLKPQRITPGPGVDLTSDIDVREFSRLLKKFKQHYPISDEFDTWLIGVPPRWWNRTQREHMVGWFAAQATTGEGQYVRKTPNYSARTAYNRSLSVGGLLWINEALGADAAAIQAACDAAKSSEHYRARCRLVRAHLPWENVYELAQPHLPKNATA